MNRLSAVLRSRRLHAAGLLLSLPALTAAASFAHGHGALALGSFLAVLAVCMATGAVAALRLLRIGRRRQVASAFPSSAPRAVTAL